jgi:formylglycine-generating enzyme required for sulfatase activity
VELRVVRDAGGAGKSGKWLLWGDRIGNVERKLVRRALGLAVMCGVLTGGAVKADVFNLGGTRNADGSWNGTASLETVPVGNPGNAADPATGSIYGSVGYSYNIGKYEVTAGQYTAFLNAVAGTDAYGLYNAHMWSVSDGCQIERYAGSGTVGDPYQYRVASDYANRPVNCVSFWDACRFANWLNNGQGGAGTTENGAYTLTTDGITNNTITRNSGATWAVTSEDEWYKAAYFDPNLGGGAGGYWHFPTAGNNVPGNDVADVSGNNANYYIQGTAYPVENHHFITAIGEFQNSDSPLGTFDQGGNLWEWNEAVFQNLRGYRGGAFNWGGSITLNSSFRTSQSASYEYWDLGFRVVQLVPEPASLGILGIAVAGMLLRRKGRTA